MNKQSLIIIVAITAIIIIIGGGTVIYLMSEQKKGPQPGPSATPGLKKETKQPAPAAPRIPLGEGVINPLKNMPPTNPLQNTTNPYENVANPFENSYQNPFKE